VRIKVTCTPLAGPDMKDPKGVILVMDEADGTR
jgi:hypothetical protein